jgi:hypothetical protein
VVKHSSSSRVEGEGCKRNATSCVRCEVEKELKCSIFDFVFDEETDIVCHSP